MRELVINGKKITDDTDCYVIAEIGQNHQGDMEKAKELFKAAAECGADAVKVQKRDNKSLFTSKLYDAPYDNENSFGDTYGKHREALEFNREEFIELKEYADELGICMFSTAWDIPSADFLDDVQMPAFKIASGDLINIPLLQHVAAKGKPIILSTGGGSIEDVKRAYHAIMPINPQLCILQCTAAYPAEPKDLNLRVIETFRKYFPDVTIGLSDHENGIDLANIAYMLGARVIEKHFTLNHAWKGTDHAFSLEPVGLRKLVRNLRRIKLSLGDGVKKRLDLEEKPLKKMGKSIVAACDLQEGHIIAQSDLAYKSPADGIPPYENNRLIGKKLKKAMNADELFSMDNIE